MEKTTYIQKIKQQDLSNQQLIMQMLHLSDEEYFNNVFDRGMDYAREETDGDEFGQQILTQSPSFWAYWKNEWAKREQHFLAMYKDSDCFDFLSDEYDFIHSYKGIVAAKRKELREKEIAEVWTKVWRELSHA
ncbi:MAG: hypothetical protein IE931_05700 [Sphingobacteriales bacterium]|nr:hypothetical protein [Sphingobacteriales bacterium]